jgi:hypothetical protein
MKKNPSSREKAQGLLGLLGLPILFVFVAVAGLLAWLIGPFGPVIYAQWMKWAVVTLDFLATCCILLFVSVVVAEETDWGENVQYWFIQAEDWLTEWFDEAEEHRRNRHQPSG